MHKLLAATFAIAASTGALHAQDLRVGVDLTYPPYNYYDDSNAPAGFDVELMKLVGEATARAPQFLDTRFENLILGVSGGQFDVIASTLFMTPARGEQVDFVPYMKTGVSIAVASASGNEFATGEDLCGKRLGSIKGAAWLPHIEALNEGVCKDNKIDSREFPTSPEATQAVMSGGVDAQMEDSAVLADAVSKLSGRLKITSQEQLYPVLVGLAVKKGNAELAEFLKDALVSLDGNETYEALFTSYGVTKPSEDDIKTLYAQ